MHFQCVKELLLSSVNIVQKAVQSSSSIEVYTGIFIEASENELTIIGTNTDLSIRTQVKADIFKPGKILIEGKLFSDIVRKWPADKPINILLDENTNNVIIDDGNKNSSFKAEVKSMNVDDYPVFPDASKELEEGLAKSWNISQNQLKKAINATAFAAAKVDHSRLYLTAILLESKDGQLRVVATDSHRLGYYKIPGLDGDISAMITADDLSDIAKLMDDEDEEKQIHLTLTPRRAFFDIDNTTVVTRLIEGNFPPYEKVIPTQHNTKVKVERKLIVDAVDRIAVMIRGGTALAVKLTIVDNFLTIASGEMEYGNAKEEIYVEKEGENLEIKVDYRFLFEGLKAFTGENVEMLFKGSDSAILFKSSDMPEYLYLMMPLNF
ncbi:MAG: DNA polymerase III subunit beta [Firmicutes bacterium]|nr:DNA polymerase III subunit beta [Bacillota bacterium]MDD4694612.1 DNA polymerase III subunit beta [Bacillota bacterium]